MKIVPLTPSEWQAFSEAAFQTVFGAVHDRRLDRISFALVMVDEEKDEPLGYLTAREMSAEDLCWEYGGAYPAKEKSVHVLRGYMMFARWCQTRYKRIFTLVENTNHRYLKLAMKIGFNIVGTRAQGGRLFVELSMEFADAVS